MLRLENTTDAVDLDTARWVWKGRRAWWAQARTQMNRSLTPGSPLTSVGDSAPLSTHSWDDAGWGGAPRRPLSLCVGMAEAGVI